MTESVRACMCVCVCVCVWERESPLVCLPLLIRTLIPSGGFTLMTSSRPSYPQGSHVQTPSCCRLGLPHMNGGWGGTSSDNPNLGLHDLPGAGRRPLMGGLLQTLILPIRKLILMGSVTCPWQCLHTYVLCTNLISLKAWSSRASNWIQLGVIISLYLFHETMLLAPSSNCNSSSGHRIRKRNRISNYHSHQCWQLRCVWSTQDLAGEERFPERNKNIKIILTVSSWPQRVEKKSEYLVRNAKQNLLGCIALQRLCQGTWLTLFSWWKRPF